FDIDPVVVGLDRTSAGPGGASDAELARTSIERLCDDSLARAEATLDEIRALDGASDDRLTWDSTAGKLDRANLATRNAGDFPALMAVAHLDGAVREKAKLCEPKIDKLETSLWMDPQIARVIKRYAGKKESLSTARARLLERTLRDFHRNG